MARSARAAGAGSSPGESSPAGHFTTTRAVAGRRALQGKCSDPMINSVILNLIQDPSLPDWMLNQVQHDGVLTNREPLLSSDHAIPTIAQKSELDVGWKVKPEVNSSATTVMISTPNNAALTWSLSPFALW